MSKSVTIDLGIQRRAAEALRETLTKLPGMDEETVRDTIEGETGLHEAIANAVALMSETELMLAGAKEKASELEARHSRYATRLDFIRTAIEQAMVIGEIRKLEFPDATLTLSNRAAGLVITDEAKVPSRFWKQPDPVLDKAAIKAALKDQETVPGATLGNGSVSLTVRRS